MKTSTIYRLSTFIILLILSSGLFAQTGPGGVGNSDGNSGNPRNILWLDASSLSYTNDDNLSTWTDESGNSNDFSQPNDSYTPIFKTVGQNGLPYAEFSKMDNRIVLNPFNDMPTTGITSFIVFKSSDTDNGLFSYNTTSSDNAFLLFNNGSLATYIDGSNTNSGTNINNGGNWQFFSHKWQSSGGNLIFNQNGDELENSTFANGDNIPTGGSFAIGGEQDSPDGGYDAGQAFQGDIAEVIMYSSYLNKAQRLLVENYLSEKYALAFTTAGNDKFGNDAAFDAAFVQNIAGIGKADDGTDHTFSGSDGLYLQERNSSLANTEFVMLAHDGTTNSSATIYTGGDLPGTTEAAWAKTWYIEKTTTDGIDTKIIFDFKEALTDGEYPATPADYVLLYRSGTTGAFSEVTTAGVGILDADQLYFDLDDANLQNGYYTIGTTDQTNSPAEGVAGRTWYALASGDWDNSNFWTLDPSGALPNNPDNEVPSNNDKVVIHTGKTISLTSDTKTVSGITIEGILQLGTTSGHNFNIIRGNGRIRLASDNFPEGDKTHFVTAGQGGGTVVWQGGTYTLNNPLTTYEFYNMEIDLDNAANSVTLLKDLALNGQFQVNQGEFYINDATQTTDLVLSVAEDVLIESNGKILTGAGNARHQFDFYGNLTNNGVLKFTNRTSATYNSEATNGIVDANFLHASRNQNIQCNGTSDFYRIEIDKGTDDTYELAIEADDASHFNLFGYANRSHDEVAQLDDNAAAANQRNPNALGLYRGTVRLKSNVNVPVLNNVVNYNISEAARLWIDGGSAAKSDGTAIVVYGKIQVTNGTLNSTVNSGITIRENGLIKVEGGTLNTNVIRTSVFGASNVGGYVQSGGTVNIVNPNSATNDYYHFSMTYPGNVFNMSGGTLHIYDAGGTATGEGGIFIASDPENINVTGGTVIAEIASTTNPFKITSTAPFYNLILRNTYDAVTDHILDAGTNINGDATADLAAQPLVVLNNLTIEANAFLNHDGNDVYISRDFYIDRNAQTVTFDNTGMNDSYNDYNVGYLFDPAIPNNTIFNGSEDGEFYIGYNSSDGFEQYFTDFTVDKTAGSKITIVCDNEKTAQYQDDNNRNHWYARLPRIENELKVENGILDQGQSAIRLFGPLTVLEDGECGVWEEGTTHPWAWFMIKDADLEINTESGAVIGNIKMNPNPQTDIITFTSDVYIKRIGYFHGRFNLQSYELKLDYLIDGLTTNNYDIDDGRDSDEMFYSSGNASDGGLLLYVPAGTTDGTTFPYPLGVLGKYTPAEIELSNVTDDGYIRITPVDGELQTTELTGGDLLNYYWKVDYQDFNSNPTVNRLRFDYNNADIVGTEANYVAGKVLDEYPFDRIYEDETIPESEGVDAANNRITFNGQTDAGFTLEKANYTAGVTGRFTGSPEIFYVRANGDWNDVDTWSYSRGGGSAGDYPKAGDIAIMRRTSVTYSGIVTVRQAEQAAAVIFDDENGWSSGCPRIVFDTQNNYASYGSDFDVVDVADTHEGGTLDYNTHGAVIQYNIEDDYSGASNSLEFDGTDDYVAIQNYNYNTDGLTEFTVEAWIKTNDAGDQIIASFDRNQYWRLEVNGNGGGNGQIGFDVMTDAGQLDFGSSSRIDDGNWHHVAGVFDNGSVSIYIDGALDNSTTSGTTFGSAGVTRYGFVGVGSEADTYDGTTGPNDYFNGNISEFRVWNVARSQAQIQAAMDAALTGSETGLDIYYKLDGSGSDNTATDITSNGNTGDLNNFSLPGAWTSSHPWGSGFPGGDFGDFNKYPNALVIYAWDGATANADVTLSSQATEYPQMWFAGGNNSRIFRFPNNDITVHGGFTVPHTAIVAANGASDNTITMEQNVNIGSSSLNYGTFLFPGNDAGLVTLDIKKNLNIRGGANSLVGIENAAGGTTVHKLKVAGDITIESSGGDIKLGDGDPVKSNVELELTGTGEHSFVNNAGALPQFYRIIMNKGTDATSTFAFNNNFSLTGSTSGAGIDKAIALQNGKLILNDAAINVDMTTGDDDFYIPASAGLEVRQGTANANGNSGILLDGKLHVSGGTVDMTGGDNYIQYSATGNAEIEVSGGTLTVGSQIRRGLTSSEGILTYTQSGGTVIVGNDAAPENNRGVFEILNTGSSFTHTGGSFQIARSQSGSPTIASFYFDPETVSLDPSSNFTIGSASTPTGQTITIYPGQPINNLTVNDDSGNSPTAQLSVVDANINNNLTIEGNTEFDANGLTVEIKGDLTNNGSYNANGNTTIFSGTADQTIDGTTTFYNLHQTSSTDLQVNSNITVANNFHIEATFTDNDNTVTVLNAIHNEGTHISGTTGGIKLQGTTDEQIMTGDGTYGILTINNAFGIKVPTGNAPFIEKQLRLSSGVFNIGGNLLTLSKDCQIIEENPFSATNMIQTNISFTDNGIKKYFPPYVGPGEESFTFPVGSGGTYTPVDVYVTQNSSENGELIVKPAAELHPSIINDTEAPDPELNDLTNVLQYHWTLISNNITDGSGRAEMFYDASDLELTSPDYNVTDYITAKLLRDADGAWNKYDNASFDETNQKLIFYFNNATDAELTGDYTAGVDGNTFNGAIPDNVPLYVSNGTGGGDWDATGTWLIDDSGTLVTPSSLGLPNVPRGARIKVQNGDVVTNTNNFISAYSLNLIGTLKMNSTYGNRLGNVEGTGTLYSERGTLPAGYYNNFFASTGGTVEYGGTSDISTLSNISEVNNLKFSGTGKRELPNLDLTILGNLIIDGDDNTLELINEFDNRTDLRGDLVFNAGSFDAGFGDNAIVVMNGSSAQTINGTNTFTGSSSFNHFEIKNSAGVTINTAVEISHNLSLTQGVINTDATNTFTLTNTDTDVVTGGSTGSFIDGPLYKNVSDGSEFTFPVGNTGRYGELYISSTSTGGSPEIWEAQYYNRDPSTNGYSTDTHDATLESVYSDGYWRIKSPNSGDAKVKIRWDGITNVPADATDRDKLRVALWDNNTTDQWIEEDDATPDAVSGTQTSGTVETNSVHTFNEFADGSYFAVGSDLEIKNFTWEGDVSADWNDGDNWLSGTVPSSSDNADIPDVGSNYFPIITSAAQCNDLTIQANASLTINPGHSLVLNGNLSYASGSNILLKADASARAHLITNGSITTSDGTAQVELYIRKNEYSYISMPLSNVLNDDFLNAPYAPYPQNDNLYEYNEAYTGSNTDYAWNFFTTAGTAFEVGKGYAHFVDVFHTYTLSGGTFNNGDISEPIVNSANGDPANGWNLIGNPYPSAVDADAFISANSGAPFSGTLYFWDDDASKGNDYASSDYATYTTVGATSGGGGKTPNGYIAPGQGFMIEASAGGNILFTNSMRTVQQGEFFKNNENGSEDIQTIRLSLLNNEDSLYNDILIAFTPKASYGYDKFMDGRKNFGNSNIGFYSLANDNVEYAIQALPFDRDEQVIRLGYITTANTSHTVKLEQLESLNEHIAVYLHDKYENETIDLRTQSTYSFESEQGTFNDRFEIIFEKPDITLTTWTGEISDKWNESGNWDSGIPYIFTEARIPKGSVKADGTIRAYKIVLGSEADLTLKESVSAEVADSVILKSDAFNNARLLDLSNQELNGKIEYLASEKNRDYFISKPVRKASASMFGESNENPGILEGYVKLFEYKNEPLRIFEAATSLENLNGYIFNNYRSDYSLSFEGKINTGKIIREFDSEGAYLLGNPYPSDLNWGTKGEAAGWEGINTLRPSLWYINRDNNTNIAAYNRLSGIAVNAGSPVIPPMNAVWVLAETAGTITVDNAAREIALSDNKASNNYQGVRLTVNANELSDETVVFFGSGHTGLDDYDTKKMFAAATNLPQIHTVSDSDEPLAINAYGTIDKHEIPVFFTSAQGGTFTMSAQVNNIDNDEIVVLLEDLNTGDIIDIDNNNYTFSSAASDKENRFILHFEKDVTSTLHPDDDQVRIYGVKDNVVVDISNFSQAQVSIYDLLGRPILSRKISQTKQFRISTSGVYIVKVKTNDNVKTAKVFIE